MTVKIRLASLLVILATAHASAAGLQSQRPRAELLPQAVSAPARPGAVARMALTVQLPKGIHVQADKPRDPSLIPTALTIEAPAGITIDRIIYPAASELAQAGGGQPLAVFGPEFTIEVQASVSAAAAAGALEVPAQLRYQACSETVCFPPARATAAWTLTVVRD